MKEKKEEILPAKFAIPLSVKVEQKKLKPEHSEAIMRMTEEQQIAEAKRLSRLSAEFEQEKPYATKTMTEEEMIDEAIRQSLLSPESLEQKKEKPPISSAAETSATVSTAHAVQIKRKLKRQKPFVMSDKPKEGLVPYKCVLGVRYFLPDIPYVLERLHNLFNVQESYRKLDLKNKSIYQKCETIFLNIKEKLDLYHKMLNEDVDESTLKLWFIEIQDLHWMIYRIDLLLKSQKIYNYVNEKEKEGLSNLLTDLIAYKNKYLKKIMDEEFDDKLCSYFETPESVLMPELESASDKIKYRTDPKFIANICRRYLKVLSEYEAITQEIGSGDVFDYDLESLNDLHEVLENLMRHLRIQLSVCANQEVAMMFRIILASSYSTLKEIRGAIEICEADLREAPETLGDKSKKKLDEKMKAAEYSTAKLMASSVSFYQPRSSYPETLLPQSEVSKKRKLEQDQSSQQPPKTDTVQQLGGMW